MSLNAGHSHIEDVPDSLLEPLGERLRATSGLEELASCEAIVICVPTPLTALSRARPQLPAARPARHSPEVLAPGQLVVLESTSYPGTTREELLPALERSGLSAGTDFHLAFSPERIDPGRTDFTVRSTPKLLGGLTAACAAAPASSTRRSAIRSSSSPTLEAAELAKLLENVFRSVNIAFVNELAQLCDRLGIDVWEVIDAAATKPFGFMRFDPGPGMGGHCLPVDPFYLAFKARENDFYPEFIELAGKVNQAQPAFCAELVERALNDAGKPVRGSQDPAPRRQLQGRGRRHPRVAGAEDRSGCCADLGGRGRLPRPPCPRAAGARPRLDRARARPARGGRGGDRHRPPRVRLRGDRRERRPLVVDFRGVTRGIEGGQRVQALSAGRRLAAPVGTPIWVERVRRRHTSGSIRPMPRRPPVGATALFVLRNGSSLSPPARLAIAPPSYTNMCSYGDSLRPGARVPLARRRDQQRRLPPEDVWEDGAAAARGDRRGA